MVKNGVMMKTILLFILLTACGHAQTIKDNSIVNRMMNFSTYSPSDIKNLQIYTSVSGNAITIGLYGADTGAAPTALKPIEIMFRNSSNGSGNYVRRLVTAATTLTVPSGTTLGTSNGVEASLWVYAIDNDGTVELGVSNYSIVDTGSVVSSTAISGGATRGVLYSTTARTSKPARLIGKILSTQTTAGTWASNPSTYQIGQFSTWVAPTVQVFSVATTSTYTTPKNVKYLRIQLVGGGGGGGGSGTASGGNGGSGGATSFGTSLLSANGGSGGQFDNAGGAGGTVATVNSPAILISSQAGGRGSSAGYGGTGYWNGGHGGSSFYGGSGGGNFAAGFDANANTGGGGGGAGTNNTASSKTGGGGGGGAFIEALIVNPDASYSYTVGAVGSRGTAGTSGFQGGQGGTGQISIVEYYQ